MSEKYNFFGWKTKVEPYFISNDDSIIFFNDVFVSEEVSNHSIVRHYIDFDTHVTIHDKEVTFEWIPTKNSNIKEVFWPGAFGVDQEDSYSILPYMQGVLIPKGYDYDYSKLAFDGQFCSAAAYMPWFGQVQNQKGYIMINQTPWDSKYKILHTKEYTNLQLRWITSLGQMSYSRKVKYVFEDHFDYNRACKIYREYSKDIGLFCTLKEKMKALPQIHDLIECSIVHTGIKTHTDPSSRFYDEHKEDVIHSFSSVEKLINMLHQNGASRLYLHLDGWGNPGYDNEHPDYLPPCIDAGGWSGLKHLQQTLTKNKDLFGLHDQYRDYYLRAKTYDIKNALMQEDGSCFEHASWAGGRENYLCAKLALSYIKRNYTEIFNHGIHLDCNYFDVFTCNELDECFNPNHKMTRKECAEHRESCFEYLIENHIIPSSEECCDWAMKSLVFSHYGPYEFMLKDETIRKMGIPVPLFNLVYHECFILPWPMDKMNEDYMLYALLNGGMPYLVRNAPYDNIDGNFGDDGISIENKIERSQLVSNFYQKVAFCEMVRHEYVSECIQRTYFDNGYCVEVNFEKSSYTIIKNE